MHLYQIHCLLMAIRGPIFSPTKSCAEKLHKIFVFFSKSDACHHIYVMNLIVYINICAIDVLELNLRFLDAACACSGVTTFSVNWHECLLYIYIYMFF